MLAMPPVCGRFPAGFLVRVWAAAGCVAAALVLMTTRSGHFLFAFFFPLIFFRFPFFFRFEAERFFFAGKYLEVGEGRGAVGGAGGQEEGGEKQRYQEREAEHARIHRRSASFPLADQVISTPSIRNRPSFIGRPPP
jgi:hypothetical protein